jgi:two-component sensor histidine kinase
MLGRTSVDPRWRTVKDDGSPFPGEEHPAMVTLRTGRSSANVVMGVHLPEGGLRWINLNSEPLMRPGAGAPYSVVTTFTDMTDRIQQQQTLRDLLKQTERDAQTKGELLREVNHRVTNNLTAVLGLMTFEQRHAQGDSGSTAAVLERLSQRIRGLLKVHRMLSQSQWAPVPVNELAGQIIRAVLNAAPWRQSAVVTIRPNAIKVSPRQAGNLAMVINELATNTVKYAGLTQDPVTIEFEAESGPEFIRLRYRDNGPGFPPEVLAKERSNIGLKLVHDLVKHSLNGSMVLTNDHGAAATLHIALEEESRT